MASLSSLAYCLWARPGAYPIVEHLRGSSIGQVPALQTDQTRLEMFATDKHSSLLRTFVNYGRRKFCNIGPWDQWHKTFYGRNLQTYVMSQSVCPIKLFQPSLKFASKARACLSETPSRYSTLVAYGVYPWQVFTRQANISGLGQEPTRTGGGGDPIKNFA